MRKGIDGLATLVQDSFELDPYSDAIFLFCCLWQTKNGSYVLLVKSRDN